MNTSDDKRVVFVKFSGLIKGKEGEMIVSEESQDSAKLPEHRDLREGIYESDHSDVVVETTSATFSRKEVCKLFDVSEGRLKYWDSTEFISPGGYKGRRRCYTFQDLISIRSALALLNNGVSLQRTRTMIEQLQRLLPKATHPLSRLRIAGDSSQVTVTEEGREFEASSGQLLIDFTVKNLEEELVSSLPDYALKQNAKSAFEWYLEACALDEDEQTLDDAEHAYHQAIVLDPTLATAYTNLGNLRYRRGAVEDSRALYLKALEIDEAQPEAQYNLGFLDYETGRLAEAERRFRRAVELDATFADAYFNLAMTQYRLGRPNDAARCWEDYLAMEPQGDWADIARNRLAEIEMEACHESH
ncbi:MAG: tetratricopeptide repeat protein [Deltaproteobacteria bacterium]|nr:tetratricopeptide repeat protein [Deltaproteobacteria bacterium]MBN2670715.1 tetratricopeptide repeat protein [Deltaproteobacteria bacterium]